MSRDPRSRDAKNRADVTFQRCVPFVWVHDFEAGVAWYRDVMGFTEHFRVVCTEEEHGCDMSFAEMSRGGLDLHVSTCQCAGEVHVGTAYFRLDLENVKALHDELAARGAHVWIPLRDHEWGIRDFTVMDPQGNRIELSGPVPDDDPL